MQSQFDLEMDADKEGYKQTVCSNGAIAVASDTVSYTPMGRLYSEEVPGVPCLVRSSPAAGNGSLISERVELPSNPAQLSLSAGGAIHVMLEGTQNGAGYSPVQLLRLDNFSTAAVLGAVALDLSVVTGPCDSYRIRPAGLQVFGDDNLLALAVYCPSAYGETTFIAIARADSLEVRGSAALTGMPFFPSLLALVHPPSKETRGGLNVSLFLTIGGTACPGYGPRASCSTLHEVCIAIAGDSATPTIVPTNRTAPLWSLQAGSATRFVALQGTESLLNQGGVAAALAPGRPASLLLAAAREPPLAPVPPFVPYVPARGSRLARLSVGSESALLDVGQLEAAAPALGQPYHVFRVAADPEHVFTIAAAPHSFLLKLRLDNLTHLVGSLAFPNVPC